jgi:hypothetical protein
LPERKTSLNGRRLLLQTERLRNDGSDNQGPFQFEKSQQVRSVFMLITTALDDRSGITIGKQVGKKKFTG